MASYYNTHQIQINDYPQPSPQYYIQQPAYIHPPHQHVIVEPVEHAHKEVIVQTTTTTDIPQKPTKKISNFSSKWIPRKKLELCEFDPYYSLNLIDRISSIEYMNIIEECSLRFREVVKPWRSFWKKHKNFVPAEFVAALATFCLSMLVTIPLWYSMYKKAKVRIYYIYFIVFLPYLIRKKLKKGK